LVRRAREFSVELRQVSLKRGARRVLHAIDWRVTTGQRWALIGGNGAGKTQLLKLLAGLVWPTPTGRERRRYRLDADVFDEPAGVLDEIAYVGAEKHDRYDRYGWNFTVEAVVGTGIHRTEIPRDPLTLAQRRRIRQLLAQFQMAGYARRRFLELSYGERRLVLLARALATKPRLLLLDEVANGLDTARHRVLLRWLEATQGGSLPWVLATHHVADVPASVTHVLALESGRVVERRRATRSAVLRLLEPRQRARAAVRPSAEPRQPGELLVRLHRASVFHEARRALDRIDLEVRAGQCWVVSGANGSGKSTLLRTIYGDHAVASDGRIERRGIVPGVPLTDFKRWVGFVAPHLQSDYPRNCTALEVVASGAHSSIGLNERLTAAEARAARSALRHFGIAAFAQRPLLELSYGQVRRVLFARAWVREPGLLLMDEPFAGLDPSTRAALLVRLERFIERGGTCILATHHRNEWPHNVTHSMTLRAGRVVHCGPVSP
jgi:molybdate transport system ATP-binding protein